MGVPKLTGQKKHMIEMLEAAGSRGVHSDDFYAAKIGRFGARLHELRNDFHFKIDSDPDGRGNCIYRLVKVSVTDHSTHHESLDDRGADLGQSPSTPERGRERQLATAAGESSITLGDRSSSPDPQDAAFEPRQVTDADGSRGHGPSASLLLFDMPVDRYVDAA